MVNNVVALTGDVAAPPRFTWGPGEPPTAMFTCARTGEWYWLPGGALEVTPDGPLAIFSARIGRTGRADAGVWDFEGRGTDIIVVDNPGAPPSEWRWRANELFDAAGGKPGRRRAWGAAVVRTGSSAFIFGIDSTDVRHKSLLAASCPADKLAQRDAWRFLSADGSWTEHADQAAAICSDVVDEFTISPVCDGTYIMVHIEPNFGSRVMVRRASSPIGPWSEAQPVYECPEPHEDTRIFVYGAKAHPGASGSGGLLVSYCVNSTDFWHMLGDASIYRPRFVRLAARGGAGAN